MTTETTTSAEFIALRDLILERFLARAPRHIEQLSWSETQIQACQRDRLRVLLRHAIDQSPFHRQRLAGVKPERFELSDLKNLPVMTKTEMMASLTEVFTDRRLNRHEVEDALARTEGEPIPIFEKFTAWATGGSSGQRGVFVYDSDATVGFLLSLWRSLLVQLKAQGGAPPGGLQLGFVAAASAVHATRAVSAWTLGARLPLRIVSVPATLPLEEIVVRLNVLNAPALGGYPSMLARLAAEKLGGRLQISPVMVVTTGETLTPQLRAGIKSGFQAPIVNSFASSEGLVGTTAPDDDVHVLNSDLCIVELVDAEYRPVPDGMPSSRVLLTNLYNLTQPLIRYELSDCFVRQSNLPNNGHVRVRVQGREDGILHYGNVAIHPHVMRSVMVKSPNVLDYRVRQTSDGMAVEVVATAGFDLDDLQAQLLHALVGAGLSDAAVSIRTVDWLPRNAASGKLSRFVGLPAQ